MSRIFNELKKNYSQIPNGVINNEEISKESRFLFILLAAQAPGFRPKQKWLLKMMNWKDRATLTKYWSEIESWGWGVRLRSRSKGGRLGVYDYHLFAVADTDRVATMKGNKTTAGSIHSGKKPQRVETTEGETDGLNNTEVTNNTNSSKKTKGGFTPPTRPELAKFMADKLKVKGCNSSRLWAWEEAQNLIDHYQLADWRKKDNSKMKNWKQAASGWINREWGRGGYRVPPKTQAKNGKPGGEYNPPEKKHAAPFAKS